MAAVSDIPACLRACVLLFTVLLTVVSAEDVTGIKLKKALMAELKRDCSAVKIAYAAKGFNAKDVPQTAMQGDQLRICPQGFTCCTPTMEHKLSTQSRQEYDKIMVEKLKYLRETFISRTAKFDVFFTELLDNAKNDLHDMFVRTYGLLYQQNSHVFTSLFNDLRSYYKGSDMSLVDALDSFFTTLLQKMFELLNAQYSFDQTYLNCVSEHMDELRPFGDVPQKLSIQVKRAFIAARTFVQGLAIGRDVILAVSKIQPTRECGKALMKMKYCPYCRGMPHVRPCNNFCLNVLKGCLANQADLNDEWNKYIDALMKVADRLEGPFNIESVVDPIDVKISDAIMNFQENGETITSKVFQGCGRPRLSERQKREASFNYKISNNDRYVRPTTAAGTSLDRLVRDIREKIKIAKGFWSNLPYAICNEVSAAPDNEDKCWNGQEKSQYMPQIMQDGVNNQQSNPEVEVDVTKPNSVVNMQIIQLRLIINKLTHAYDGLDVDWIDTADVTGSGSGSGSGAGDDVGSGMNGGYGGYTGGRRFPPDYGLHRLNNPKDKSSFDFATENPPPVIRTQRPSNSAATIYIHTKFFLAAVVLPSIITTLLLNRFC